MILYPAIDLKNGQCVRLKQGEMDSATVFNDDPGALGSACLITDWDMPTFDGLELLRHVRGQDWNAPVSSHTATASEI